MRSKKKKWPGLASETRTICEKLMIEDCNITQLSKSKNREYVTQACHTLNEKWLREKATGIRCARIASEGYGREKYIQEKNISDVRDHYRTRFGLLVSQEITHMTNNMPKQTVNASSYKKVKIAYYQDGVRCMGTSIGTWKT